MNEIRYEIPTDEIDTRLQTIFLAGPTVRGHQPHLTSWRFAAVDLFKQFKFEGNLIIPEFTDKGESDQFRYDIPQWEYAGLQMAHVIMFWIPRTRELIGLTTNHEHGYWMALDRDKVVYGRPNDAYRMTYLDIMWVEDAKRLAKETGHYVPCPIYNTLEKTVRATLRRFHPWDKAWLDANGTQNPAMEPIVKDKPCFVIRNPNLCPQPHQI